MTDSPIIFSAPMVRALLEGRKTQTRRVLKPQPPDEGARYSGVHFACDEPDSWFFNSPWGPFKVRAKYIEGDRLWVREAWAQPALMDVQYRADPPVRRGHWDGATGPWRSPIHMPRWASRLTLTVTDVRVQRLQEISEADARAEGLEFRLDWLPQYRGSSKLPWRSEFASDAYADLWNSIHGVDAWSLNPFVVALTFTVERRNIDSKQSAAA